MTGIPTPGLPSATPTFQKPRPTRIPAIVDEIRSWRRTPELATLQELLVKLCDEIREAPHRAVHEDQRTRPTRIQP